MKFELAVVLLISLLLLSLTYYFSLNSKTYWWDEAVYLGIARNLATKMYFGIDFLIPERLFDFYEYRLIIDESFRQPLFPFLLSFFYWLGENIQRFLSPFFASLTILTTYIVAKRIKNKIVGIVACLFLTSSHYFLFFSSKILTESLSAFLFTLSFYFLFLFEKNKKFLVPFSIVFSLSILTRYPNALLAFPFLFIVLKKKDIKSFILFSVIGFTIIVPWLIFNYLRYDNPLGFLVVSLSEIVSPSKEIVKKYFYYPPYYYLINLLEIFGLPIFFSLFFFLNWKKENKLLFSTLILIFLAFSLLPRKEFRYLVPFFPLFYISSSIGIYNAIKQRNFLLIIISLIFVLEFFVSLKLLTVKEDDSLIKVAYFLKERVSEGNFIIGENYPVLNYLTKAYVLPFPGDLEHFWKVVKTFNVSYVIIDKEITVPPYAFELENYGFEKNFEYGNAKVLIKRV
jgi:4-amino-4-deoxy-L-arabinose transferase-like glycosyltransferase